MTSILLVLFLLNLLAVGVTAKGRAAQVSAWMMLLSSTALLIHLEVGR